MIAKHMTVALIGSALLATAAVAQTSTTTTNTMSAPAATSSESGYHGDWRSSKMIGLNVYNDANEKLGSISDLLLDKSGKINAAVIGVGGFLGVGERLVAVSFDKIKFLDTPVPSTSASTTAPAGNGMRSETTTGAATSAPAATNTKTNPWYPDHAVFNASKEQLKAMPEFKYST
ncbi:PRC-barrel [Nitrobacter hamburgensis X14]|uniref:PRC-barrel n=1 Tax=Nitrobacter hamburgensis (strain DSM 10229 / NCIMB 13809 / X14) TaxID=323097 RepID=Q1QJE1_NITHX|nr:PRC-barrel domain-containing protein [Nitrobacter hamburgensis]ABE63656.1 PRC-barrel [Nitrobacter hamburgensis X14]